MTKYKIRKEYGLYYFYTSSTQREETLRRSNALYYLVIVDIFSTEKEAEDAMANSDLLHYEHTIIPIYTKVIDFDDNEQ